MLPQWLCGRESLNAMGVRGVCVFGDHHVVRGLKNPEGLKKPANGAVNTLHFYTHHHHHNPGNNRALTSILERSKNVLFWVGRILMADGLIFIQN